MDVKIDISKEIALDENYVQNHDYFLANSKVCKISNNETDFIMFLYPPQQNHTVCYILLFLQRNIVHTI